MASANDKVSPFPDVWIVFSCGEIVGIYPNDESKADEVTAIFADAQKVCYRAACSQTVAPGREIKRYMVHESRVRWEKELAEWEEDQDAYGATPDQRAVFWLLLELKDAERWLAAPPAVSTPRLEHDLLIQDLAMLVRRLIRRIKRKEPDDKVAAQAADFIKRKGLQGNICRTAQDNFGNGELPEVGTASTRPTLEELSVSFDLLFGKYRALLKANADPLALLDYEDEIRRRVGAVSTPRCPVCGHGSLRYFTEIGEVMCHNRHVFSMPRLRVAHSVPLEDFAQFFHPGSQPSPWVSVKERLPQAVNGIGGWFLVTNGTRYDVAKCLKGETFMGHALQFGDITHWMPLPAQPSPEGGSK